MSKIKINEIESLSNNGNLELTPNGTGVVEIKSDETDGTLQLNSTANNSKVKIASPPSTAAQDYTLILPDNQIAQDKYLRVKSITGSGSTAVGQLEYATVTPPNINLDAAQLTTGSLDAARLPSPLPATAGLGLKHISTYVVNTSIHYFDITTLEADSVYRIVIRNWNYNGNGSRAQMKFFDTNGTLIDNNYSPATYYDCVRWYSYKYNPGGYDLRQTQTDIQIDADEYGNQHYALGFIADLTTGSTANPNAGVHIKALRPYNSMSYIAYTNAVLHSTKVPVGGIRLGNSTGYALNIGLECSIYKYMEV
tara:strand:- start:49 stop:975 length:927 start_codon:yes stop_codon:yes gene_type:complete